MKRVGLAIVALALAWWITIKIGGYTFEIEIIGDKPKTASDGSGSGGGSF